MAISVSWTLGRQEMGITATLVLTTFLVALLSLPIVFYLSWRWRKEEEETSLPPGPRGLPLLGYLPFLGPDLHRCFAELASTYGPVMRLRLGSRVCVVLSSPAAAKEALKDHDTIFASHDVPATALASVYEGQDMLWAPYGPHWRMLRKVSVRELLSPATIEGLYAVRRREVRRMLEEVRARSGKPVNVREVVSATALNATTMMLWGDTATGDGKALGREFRQVIDAVIQLLGEPNVSDFFPALARLDLQGLGRRMRKLSASLDRILDSIIEQRLRTAAGGGDGDGGAGKRRDFLLVMLELQQNGDPQAPLTMLHVKALFQDLIGAGTDTTATTVEWAMVELLCNPEKMRKAKEEITAVVGKDDAVEEFHLPKLHYLDAVVKEALRLHPVLPLLVPHRASSSCTIAGYKIPEGAKVFINAWAIHMDPQFWKNASVFEPERFLSAGNKLDYTGNSFHYLPFGAGRRICPGVTLGERMVMFMLASLLHSVDWTLPEGVELDVSEKFGIVMRKEEALVAVPT